MISLAYHEENGTAHDIELADMAANLVDKAGSRERARLVLDKAERLVERVRQAISEASE